MTPLIVNIPYLHKKYGDLINKHLQNPENYSIFSLITEVDERARKEENEAGK